jgi:hypothetical protein
VYVVVIIHNLHFTEFEYCIDNNTHKLLPFVSLLYHHKAPGSRRQQAQSASSIKGYYTDIIAKICINMTGGEYKEVL